MICYPANLSVGYLANGAEWATYLSCGEMKITKSFAHILGTNLQWCLSEGLCPYHHIYRSRDIRALIKRESLLSFRDQN